MSRIIFLKCGWSDSQGMAPCPAPVCVAAFGCRKTDQTCRATICSVGPFQCYSGIVINTAHSSPSLAEGGQSGEPLVHPTGAGMPQGAPVMTGRLKRCCRKAPSRSDRRPARRRSDGFGPLLVTQHSVAVCGKRGVLHVRLSPQTRGSAWPRLPARRRPPHGAPLCEGQSPAWRWPGCEGSVLVESFSKWVLGILTLCVSAARGWKPEKHTQMCLPQGRIQKVCYGSASFEGLAPPTFCPTYREHEGYKKSGKCEGLQWETGCKCTIVCTSQRKEVIVSRDPIITPREGPSVPCVSPAQTLPCRWLQLKSVTFHCELVSPYLVCR